MESQEGNQEISTELSVIFRFFLFLFRKVVNGNNGCCKANCDADNPDENFRGAADRCTEHIDHLLVNYEYKVKFKYFAMKIRLLFYYFSIQQFNIIVIANEVLTSGQGEAISH